MKEGGMERKKKNRAREERETSKPTHTLSDPRPQTKKSSGKTMKNEGAREALSLFGRKN